MIIFIKKIKTKEGINSIDLEKVKNDVPSGYKAVGGDPEVSFTANHLVVAIKCLAAPKPAEKAKAKAKNKVKTKGKKIVVAKV